MARTRTLLQLRDEVRQRADIENDPHITDAEITRFVNQSAAALHALMVDMDETFFFLENTIVTTPGVEYIDLKTAGGVDYDVYKILHVEANINGWTRTLERWTFDTRTLYKNASTWGVQAMPISYRYVRPQTGIVRLYFAPVPDGAYSVTFAYVKGYTDMTADADTYDGADGWEEWVVLDAAIKCVTKEEGSLTDLQNERAQVFARIAAQMQTPDLDHPSIVRDTEGRQQQGWLQVRS